MLHKLYMQVLLHHTHLSSGEAHVLPHLLGHLHGLLGTSNIILAELDPLLGGGGATTMTSFAHFN